MITRIPESILEDILGRVDIVELIQGYIPLKKAGRNFKTTCPFHHEKTPSFMVSPDRQIYHCFGCGESGNAFKFLMRYERLEFPEAVEALAKKAGVVLPQIEEFDSKTKSFYDRLYQLNELAALFYENNLHSKANASVRDYLAKRGIKYETAKKLKLGFAPDGWDGLLNFLRAKGFDLQILDKSGLIVAKDRGGYHDRFRNRVIYPVFDIKSRIIAFGARVLDNSLPKYLNSPETPIYVKGRNLYGLNFAKDFIRDKDFVILVEGYMDFIIPYQAGICNIVATSGTALTDEQVRLIKRYTHNVVVVFDPDAAGQMAALRSLDIFIQEGLDVKVVSLPPGLDPDSFVHKNGQQAFADAIGCAENIFDYKLNLLKKRYGIVSIEGKARIAEDMLSSIAKFKNAVIKTEYLKKLAQKLDLKEEALIEEFKKIKQDKNIDSDNPQPLRPAIFNISPAEKLLIKLMLEENNVIARIKEHFQPGDFSDDRIARIVSLMFDLLDEGKPIEPSSFLNHVQDQGLLEIICESAFLPELSDENRTRVVDDCINRLKKEKMRLKKEQLHDQIKAAQASGDEESLHKLMQEFQHLIKIKPQ